MWQSHGQKANLKHKHPVLCGTVQLKDKLTTGSTNGGQQLL